MTEPMDMADLDRVNRLWKNIYPGIAAQILEHFTRKDGDVLEWGPFSGGIAVSLVDRYPSLKIGIAVPEELVSRLMTQYIAEAGYEGKISLAQSGLSPLVFNDETFDLIVIRGAFFFLDDEGAALQELYRVLKPGGIGFVGGGYGKYTAPEIINGIAEESRILNDRLGRMRVTVPGLAGMIDRAGLTGRIQIVEEGGLWLLIRKP